jgi:hypothetical protein
VESSLRCFVDLFVGAVDDGQIGSDSRFIDGFPCFKVAVVFLTIKVGLEG